MRRKIEATYSDPVDLIWTSLARRLGIAVVRDDEVFAAWDGMGKLRLGAASLDPDDSSAQMILHELCHWMVEGQTGFEQADWGLDFENPDHRANEFAALRVQAKWADEVGMRRFFASTTDFRAYYDRLPKDPLDPLEPCRPDWRSDDRRATKMAKVGWQRAQDERWEDPIRQALVATRDIQAAVRIFADPGSLWSLDSGPAD